MPTLLRLRPGVPRLAVVLSLGLLAFSFAWQVPTTRAAGAASTQANEIVRLINGARAAAGKPALVVDVFLASEATNGAIPCPDDPAQTIAGRAQDFAATGQMSHVLRLCNAATYTPSGTTFVSDLQNNWGYGSVGEILLVNGGYGYGQFLYTSGNWSTWTYATTGHAMTAWKTSATHWNIIVGGYDRVGCGAWSPSGSTVYYACEFSSGGPSPAGVLGAPTSSPFSTPLPPAAPTAEPTAPPIPAPTRVPAPPVVKVAPVVPPTSTPVRVASPSGLATPEATVDATPTALPTALPTSIVQGAQAEASQVAPGLPAAVAGGVGDLDVVSNSAAIPAGLTRDAVLGFSAGAVMLVGIWVLIDRVRRRRRKQALL